MRLSDEGGRCADKIGRRVARIAIADLDRVGRVFLHQPEDQRLRACLRTAPGRRMSDSVVVVEVGTRGRAGRVHTASRCLTWGWRPWKWPQRRAACAWQQSEPYYLAGKYNS